MKLTHERFEALGGALALGEATPAERAEFAAHAARCRQCREDFAAVPLLRRLVETARDGERWRPLVRDALVSRIRDRDGRRSRAVVAALGWALGISLVIDAALATGAGASVARALASGEIATALVARFEGSPRQLASVTVVRSARPVRGGTPDDVLPGLELRVTGSAQTLEAACAGRAFTVENACRSLATGR